MSPIDPRRPSFEDLPPERRNDYERIWRWLDRAPFPLHVPRGDAGDGRRLCLSHAFASGTIICVLALVLAITGGTWSTKVNRITMIRVAFFFPPIDVAAALVVGSVVDATRGIESEAVRSIFRGALVGAVVFVAGVGALLAVGAPLNPDGALRLTPYASIAGGLAGIVSYIRDRIARAQQR